MELTPEDFDEKFKATLDALVESMAEHPEIDVRKFYSLTCFVENLSYFSPVVFGILKDSSKTK